MAVDGGGLCSNHEPINEWEDEGMICIFVEKNWTSHCSGPAGLPTKMGKGSHASKKKDTKMGEGGLEIDTKYAVDKTTSEKADAAMRALLEEQEEQEEQESAKETKKCKKEKQKKQQSQNKENNKEEEKGEAKLGVRVLACRICVRVQLCAVCMVVLWR